MYNNTSLLFAGNLYILFILLGTYIHCYYCWLQLRGCQRLAATLKSQ